MNLNKVIMCVIIYRQLIKKIRRENLPHVEFCKGSKHSSNPSAHLSGIAQEPKQQTVKVY